MVNPFWKACWKSILNAGSTRSNPVAKMGEAFSGRRNHLHGKSFAERVDDKILAT